MQQNKATYIIGFAAAVCLVCSLLVSSAATILKERQLANALFYKQKQIIAVSGLVEEGTEITRAQVTELFGTRIATKIISLETGEDAPEGKFDPALYDQKKALSDPALSSVAPDNKARIQRLPDYATVYEITNEEGEVDLLVLPIEGKGLWSTLYGFLALDRDCNTVRGLTFYSHGETPGLGGEIDNPTWKNRWPGRKIFDQDGTPVIKVIKGPAGSAEEDPHRVDGLSGATLTSNGVTFLVQFWMGDLGFGPYLERFRAGGGAT